MIKKLSLLLIILFLTTQSYSQIVNNPAPLEITEEDGSPSTFPYKLKFTNGALIDNTDGTVSISSSTFAATSLTGLSDVGSAAVTAGNILIADGTKYQSVQMSGDSTITSAGVVNISNINNTVSATGFVGLGDILAFTTGLNEWFLTGTGAGPAGLMSFTSGMYLVAGGFDDYAFHYLVDTTLGLRFNETSGYFEFEATGSVPVWQSAPSTGNMRISGAFDKISAGAMNIGSVNATSMVLGSSSNTSLTVTTDGTGDGEVVLPTSSIGAGEIASTTVSAGTYTTADITVDADGRITAASNGAASGATHLTGLSDVGTASVTSGNILVADGTKYQSVIMSGDITMDSAGVTTVGPDKVALGTDTNGNYTRTITTSALDGLTGGAATEAANVVLGLDYTATVAANPALSAGQALFGTTGVIFEGTVADTNEGNLRWPAITSDQTITLPNQTGTVVVQGSVAAGNIMIADGSFYQSVAMSGDVTILSTGATNIATNVVGSNEIIATAVTAGTYTTASIVVDADGRITSASNGSGGATSLTGLSDVGSAAVTAGNLLIADGTKYQSVAMSGDVTITSVGVTAIGANKVTDSMLANTMSIDMPVESAKLTGAFVVQTIGGGDASTQGAQIDGGDGNWRLLFDETTDEAAVWQFRLPDYWAAHGSFKIQYSMTSATTGTVEYEVAIMCVSDGDSADVGSASFANVAVGSATVPGTAGFPDEISITPTDDSCAAGDMMWVYLSTDANDGANDTATGDREVVNFQYVYTR